MMVMMTMTIVLMVVVNTGSTTRCSFLHDLFQQGEMLPAIVIRDYGFCLLHSCTYFLLIIGLVLADS